MFSLQQFSLPSVLHHRHTRRIIADPASHRIRAAAAPRAAGSPARQVRQIHVPILLFAPEHHLQRPVSEGGYNPLAPDHGARKPGLALLLRRQDCRHSLRMDGRDLGIGLCRQKPEQVSCNLALLNLLNRGPLGPDPGEKSHRPIFVEREPDWLLGAARRQFVLGKTGERDETAVLWTEPPPPVRRHGIADIGDAGIGFLALEREQRRRHPPAGQDKLPDLRVLRALRALPHNRPALVGGEARKRRHVASPINHRLHRSRMAC
jgi:hypothetical protein